MSSFIGASLVSCDKLFYGVVGDFACFYDFNSLGNRHIGANAHIIVIDNGAGAEFKNYDHRAAKSSDKNPMRIWRFADIVETSLMN